MKYKIITNCLNTITPKPAGKYTVGCSAIDLYDTTRKSEGYLTGWLIPIRIYYPINLVQNTYRKSYALQIEPRSVNIWDKVQYNVYSKLSDIKKIYKGNWPLVFVNHGLNASLTDYSWICEELSSQGYIVISIQHQLESDSKNCVTSYDKDYSIKLHARFIENMLYVHKWAFNDSDRVLRRHIDFTRICLLGHSFGANAILLLQSRTIGTDTIDRTMLPVYGCPSKKTKECAVLMDSNHMFSFPNHSKTPILFQVSQERKDRFERNGLADQIKGAGHLVNFYEHSKHISFLDHGYLEPQGCNSKQQYFSGTQSQREAFFNTLRKNIVFFISKALNT